MIITMSVENAIDKLKTSNRGLNTIRDNIQEHLGDLRNEPAMENLVDDMEALFESYLATWIKSNSEIIEILEKGD